MLSSPSAMLGLAAALVLAAGSGRAAPSDGAALFANQCASCHGSEPGEAPAKQTLTEKTPDAIVESLTAGAMQYVAAGLSADDIRAIAIYLTGPAPPPAAVAPAAK
jgi:mono/diheme cytochrome c family protein